MTSTPSVQFEIDRFLTTKEPEVLCISGDWGIGKTYNWQTRWKHAQEHGQIALAKYSYVSLFGINSLEALKLAAFENTEFIQPQRSGIVELINYILAFARRAKPAAAFLPQASKILKEAGPLFFSTVRNQIVCIDDVERRGTGLTLTDVFGLISYLKEHRRCKIILLLNEEQLGTEKKEFEKHHEKVIDTFLKFAPTPAEAVEIALQSHSPFIQKLADNCKALGISNIRVIKKLERLVEKILPILQPYDEQVTHQAIHTLTLFGWAKLQAGIAPSLADIQRLKREDFLGRHGAEAPQKTDEERKKDERWKSVLDSYGFTTIDEFDRVLMLGLESGYFDPQAIKDRASTLDHSIKARAEMGSFEGAWEEFYNSFGGDEEQILQRIYESARQNLLRITRENLSNTFKMLKEFGRAHQAEELLREYVTARNEERQFWALEGLFPGDRIEPDVEAAFTDKLASLEENFDPLQALLKIGEQQSWHDSDIEKLAALSPGDFYKIFKAEEGKRLRRLVRAALQFSNYDQGASELEIAKAAKEALKQIGQESRLNAERVKRIWGIDLLVEPEDGQTALEEDITLTSQRESAP